MINKTKSYAEYVKEEESTSVLRDLFCELDNERYKIHSDDYISGHFKQVGVEYSTKTDVDALVYCIAEELDRREGTETVKLLHKKQKIQNLDSILSSGNKSIVGLLENVIQLHQPLDELFKELYKSLKNYDDVNLKVKTSEMDGEDLPGYFRLWKKGKKIRIGIVGAEEKKWQNLTRDQFAGGYYGFEIFLKEKGIFNKKLKYHVRISTGWYNQWDEHCKSMSLGSFLYKVKSSLESNHPESGKYVDYLHSMLRLPDLVIKANDANKKRIKTAISGLQTKKEKEEEKFKSKPDE